MRAAYPIPIPPPPIIIGGETPAGARLAGRIGDGWSAFDVNFEANLPLYLESLEAAGRGARTSASSSGSRATGSGEEPIIESPWAEAPRDAWDRWHAAGADEVIVLAKTTEDVDALVAAVDRW